MFENTFKQVQEILWKEEKCNSELDYTEQTSSVSAIRFQVTGYIKDFYKTYTYSINDYGLPRPLEIKTPHRAHIKTTSRNIF